MTPLGFTAQMSLTPDPFTLLPRSDLYIVATRNTIGAARDRLAAMLNVATHLPSFVPLRPAQAPSCDTVDAWLADHRAAILQDLDRLKGMAELILQIAHCPAAPLGSGDANGSSWLARRAAWHREASKKRRELTAFLDELCVAEQITDRITWCDAAMVHRALLVPRSAATDVATSVKTAWQKLALPSSNVRHPVLTGPWPPLHFTRIGDTGEH